MSSPDLGSYHCMCVSMQPFASTPGKVLVWREASAQHHLSDGGEWPAWIFGAYADPVSFTFHESHYTSA